MFNQSSRRHTQLGQCVAFVASLLLALAVLGMLTFALPALASGLDPDVGLVPCGVDAVDEECNVCHVQVLGMKVISYFVLIVVVLAAILFANAGVIYIFSPTNPSNIATAHRIFMNTLIGLLLMLAAYMVVDVIMKSTYEADGAPQRWGPWNNILDCSKINIETAADFIPSTTNGPGIILADPDRLTANEAYSMLPPGVTTNNPEPITSLDGVREDTMVGFGTLANDMIDSGIPVESIVITGGTEMTGTHTAGDQSHLTGYKLDIRNWDPAVGEYITTNFKQIDSWSDGTEVYSQTKDGMVTTCAAESSHWDCKFVPVAGSAG